MWINFEYNKLLCLKFAVSWYNVTSLIILSKKISVFTLLLILLKVIICQKDFLSMEACLSAVCGGRGQAGLPVVLVDTSHHLGLWCFCIFWFLFLIQPLNWLVSVIFAFSVHDVTLFSVIRCFWLRFCFMLLLVWSVMFIIYVFSQDSPLPYLRNALLLLFCFVFFIWNQVLLELWTRFDFCVQKRVPIGEILHSTA